ncbi:MAG TPA: hypothetical protein VIH42_02605 [Thermoguttaceae bacterium]
MTYTIRILTEVKENHQVTLTLPPEIPTGPAEVVVNVSTPTGALPQKKRTSLAQWADEFAQHHGAQIQSTDVESFTGRRF